MIKHIKTFQILEDNIPLGKCHTVSELNKLISDKYCRVKSKKQLTMQGRDLLQVLTNMKLVIKYYFTPKNKKVIASKYFDKCAEIDFHRKIVMKYTCWSQEKCYSVVKYPDVPIELGHFTKLELSLLFRLYESGFVREAIGFLEKLDERPVNVEPQYRVLKRRRMSKDIGFKQKSYGSYSNPIDVIEL
ncbi:uncharacterized protein ASCRUDRAFT_75244 [Ascoidea rubescens DSM 1968]|uniref:Uncharacterized protein n=1 Tax=Ascoidea rubescens DSM 1968 TaxID=1344418 RepID=A0A1D2VK78_9ASCO|nr:hypothetical protein ASCRUDRAFT_75244 [Ascoidea rubescens DSM 1968]ODV62016.1 hypothetical protein ASCRUDRAFT_75244 [Ascoidea rubescens DSM 1968]